ncbi:MAG: 50S ribosomal protein L33 [Polyangiaceae bacterium]|nr:50S ribosomal protein L33 [Polyangiaceae bacterium]
MGFRERERKSKRVPIALSCLTCGARNYKTTKSRTEGGEPLSLKKFCKSCGTHTMHQEAK